MQRLSQIIGSDPILAEGTDTFPQGRAAHSKNNEFFGVFRFAKTLFLRLKLVRFEKTTPAGSQF
jgi:hypothetical protein